MTCMMKIAFGAVGFLAIAAVPATALTVSNLSDKSQNVTADLGVAEPMTTIDPGKSATIECPDGCELRGTTYSYGLAVRNGDRVEIAPNGMLRHAHGSAREQAVPGGSAAAKPAG